MTELMAPNSHLDFYVDELKEINTEKLRSGETNRNDLMTF